MNQFVLLSITYISEEDLQMFILIKIACNKDRVGTQNSSFPDKLQWRCFTHEMWQM